MVFDQNMNITLPKVTGSDLASKVLFREEEIKKMIVDDLTDNQISSAVYDLTSNDHEDGCKSDVVYAAKDEQHSQRTPPILVEIQQKVDLAFIKRLTRYCLSIHDVYNVKPVVAVFMIKGFSSNAFRDSTFVKEENEPYFRCKQNLCYNLQ